MNRKLNWIFITGRIESCQNDNYRYSQWRKFHQNDINLISVSAMSGSVRHAFFRWITFLKWFIHPRQFLFKDIQYCAVHLGHLLPTRFNFDPSMDKSSRTQ